jgi:hypothetical protein
MLAFFPMERPPYNRFVPGAPNPPRLQDQYATAALFQALALSAGATNAGGATFAGSTLSAGFTGQGRQVRMLEDFAFSQGALYQAAFLGYRGRPASQ